MYRIVGRQTRLGYRYRPNFRLVSRHRLSNSMVTRDGDKHLGSGGAISLVRVQLVWPAPWATGLPAVARPASTESSKNTLSWTFAPTGGRRV